MDKNAQTIIKPNEDKEVQEAQIAQGIKYYLTPKYMMWEQYFFDRSDKDCFGNATQSALKAYNLDPKDPKAYNVAAHIGCNNVKKVKNLRHRYWEKKGVTAGKILDLYMQLIEERKDINLLYSVAQDMEIDLPEYKNVLPPNSRNPFQQNNQINIEGGVNLAQLTDDQLRQLIESKRFALRSTNLIGSGETNKTESAALHSESSETVPGDK